MRKRKSRFLLIALLIILGTALGFGPTRALLQTWSHEPFTVEIFNEASPSFFKITPRTAMALETGVVEDVPKENLLIIPKIGVSTKILEGSSLNILDKGIWHRPSTGSPTAGNMVLAGHRYMWKSGPDTFYYLPELKNGDKIRIYWKEARYDYQVSEVFTVDAEATDIEAHTNDNVLTLYTCTLLTAEERVVIKAVPIINTNNSLAVK